VKPDNGAEGKFGSRVIVIHGAGVVIQSRGQLYRVEKWPDAEGRLVMASCLCRCRTRVLGGTWTTLRSFVLYQYYHAQVTEPLILEEFAGVGSGDLSGELHKLITEGKEQFHREKDEILPVGLRVSGHIHADDTGARHQGKNGYATYIGKRVVCMVRDHGEQEPHQLFSSFCAPGAPTTSCVVRRSSTWPRRSCRRCVLAKLCRRRGPVFADRNCWQAAPQGGVFATRAISDRYRGCLLGSVLELRRESATRHRQR